jgi:hypothetical protein
VEQSNEKKQIVASENSEITAERPNDNKQISKKGSKNFELTYLKHLTTKFLATCQIHRA